MSEGYILSERTEVTFLTTLLLFILIQHAAKTLLHSSSSSTSTTSNMWQNMRSWANPPAQSVYLWGWSTHLPRLSACRKHTWPDTDNFAVGIWGLSTHCCDEQQENKCINESVQWCVWENCISPSEAVHDQVSIKKWTAWCNHKKEMRADQERRLCVKRYNSECEWCRQMLTRIFFMMLSQQCVHLSRPLDAWSH